MLGRSNWMLAEDPGDRSRCTLVEEESRTTLMTAANPCLIAFALDLALPSMEVGPWDLDPLMRACLERESFSGMGCPFWSQLRTVVPRS